MASDYVPARGDAVWINLNPQAGHEQAGHEQAGHEQAGHEQAGHEQAGRRPALVLSPWAYNAKVGLAILCPITNQVKGYPFEVVIPVGLGVAGAILSDQVKSLDWRARNVDLICAVPAETLAVVLQKLGVLLSPAEQPGA